MLESIRQYAAENLGEETAPTMLRHGSHFASFGKEVYIESLDTHGGVERRKTLALEFENFLAGVDAGLAAGELEVAAGCALAGGELFRINGPFSDGIALLERFSEQPIDLGTKARFFDMGGWFLQLAGRPVESLEHWDQALAIHKELGSLRNEGKTLAHQAVFCFEQGRIPEALEHFSRALAIHQEVGDRRFEAISLGGLAVLLANEGRNSEALEHYRQMLAITRTVGDRRMEGLTLGNLAAFYHDQGRVPESLEHYDMALKMARSVGDRRMEGLSLGNLGRLLFTQGDLPSAEAHLRDAILISDEIWPTAAGAFRGSLALLRAQQGAWEEARSLLAQGESQVRGVYAIELGKLLSKKARVEHLAGDSAAAATALAEAESIAVKLGAGPDADLSQALAEARAVMAR
jgi:tetratricopeptide (TPR) repeat protein